MSYIKGINFIQRKYEGKSKAITFKSLPRFTKDVSIDNGEYILLVGASGSSKTRLCVRLFILDVIDFVRKNKDTDCRIVYFSTELTAEHIYLLIFCALLHEYTGEDYSVDFFKNKLEENKLSPKVFEDLHEIKDILEFLDKKLVIYDNLFTPDSVWKTLKKEYLDELYKEKDGLFSKKNEDLKLFIITDTINAFQANKTHTKYDSVKEWSEYYCKQVLKIQYDAIVVNVQQLDKQSTSAQYTSQGKVIEDKFSPKLENLSTVKTTPDDASLVLSIFNPARYKIPFWQGHGVTKHGQNFRHVEVLKNTNGEENLSCAMLIDNANMQLLELNKIKEEEEKPEVK